jgi:hypothetical protein
MRRTVFREPAPLALVVSRLWFGKIRIAQGRQREREEQKYHEGEREGRGGCRSGMSAGQDPGRQANVMLDMGCTVSVGIDGHRGFSRGGASFELPRASW